jgi:hypothetical protein
LNMLAEMQRAREMTNEEWEKEKGERNTQLKKKKNIVQLPGNVASSNAAQFKENIAAHTMKQEASLVVGKQK